MQAAINPTLSHSAVVDTFVSVDSILLAAEAVDLHKAFFFFLFSPPCGTANGQSQCFWDDTRALMQTRLIGDICVNSGSRLILQQAISQFSYYPSLRKREEIKEPEM